MTIDQLAQQLLEEYKADGRHAQVEYAGVAVRADLFHSRLEFRRGKWLERGSVRIATEFQGKEQVLPWLGYEPGRNIGATVSPLWSDSDFLRTARWVIDSLMRQTRKQTIDALQGLGE